MDALNLIQPENLDRLRARTPPAAEPIVSRDLDGKVEGIGEMPEAQAGGTACRG
jgi:hypothetical protein